MLSNGSGKGRKLTLLAAEVFLEGGAVTEIRPPPPRTGDLLSSLAVTKKECNEAVVDTIGAPTSLSSG